MSTVGLPSAEGARRMLRDARPILTGWQQWDWCLPVPG
jgi:hypothetical protein